MLRVYWLKYLLGEPTVVDFLAMLRASDLFRGLCEFGDRVPSESTCSRFYSELANHALDVDQLTASMVHRLRQHFPDLGDVVSVDGTDIESWSNPRRKEKSDPDATWGVRTVKNKAGGETNNTGGKKGKKASGEEHQDSGEKKKTEYFYGYKMHCLADATYGTPLVFTVLPANEPETTQLPVLVTKAQQTYDWFSPKFLVADRGYDGQPNHLYLISQGITPIIHVKKSKAEDGLHDGIYTTKGIPTCDSRTAMEYVKTDPDTGKHLYRCPAEGCILKRRSSGAVRYCDTTDHWEDPKDNPRVIGVVARVSQLWKDLYRLRTAIERYFSSGKRSRLLNGSKYLTMNKVVTNCAMSVLTYIATVLAKVEAGDIANMGLMDLGI